MKFDSTREIESLVERIEAFDCDGTLERIEVLNAEERTLVARKILPRLERLQRARARRYPGTILASFRSGPAPDALGVAVSCLAPPEIAVHSFVAVEVRFFRRVLALREAQSRAELCELVCDHIARHAVGWLWITIRSCVREGIIAPPVSDGYALGMLLVCQHGRAPSLEAELRVDPELLGSVLTRVFELEGTSMVSFANVDKFAGQSARQWLPTLVQLAREGVVGRARLLDLSLAALKRDFPAYKAGWFARLHEALEPTESERRARFAEYRHLLGSRVPQVQSFAMTALELALDDQSMLGPEVLDALAPVWTARQVTSVRRAIKVALRIARAIPQQRSRVSVAVAAALAHENATVQAESFAALEHLDCRDAAVRAAVEQHRAMLVASVRNDVERWIGASDPSELAREAILEPFQVRSPSMALDHARRIHPIVNLDELVLELTHLLMGGEDALALERCMDGMSRFHVDRPSDFDARTGALRRLSNTPRAPSVARLQLFVGAWLDQVDGGRDLERWPTDRLEREALDVLLPRWIELAAQCASGRPALPLLAMPTHAPAWIEASEFIRRWKMWRRAAVAPGEIDLKQALLRLAPEGRDEAFAAELSTDLHLASAFAESRPLFRNEFDNALVVAIKWRTPRNVDGDILRERGGAPVQWLGAEGSDDPEDASRLEDLLRGLPDEFARLVRMRVEQRVGRWYPTEFELPVFFRALAQVAPSRPEVTFALGLMRIAWNVDGAMVDHSGFTLLEPLLEPTTVLGPHAYLLLALALAARTARVHGLAIDAFLLCTEQQRLDPLALGTAMAALFELRFAPMQRWAKTLRAAARANPRAGQAVRVALERTLRGPADELPKDLSSLLELLHDLCVEHSLPVRDAECVEFLRRVAGRTKNQSGRAALRILNADARAVD